MAKQPEEKNKTILPQTAGLTHAQMHARGIEHVQGDEHVHSSEHVHTHAAEHSHSHTHDPEEMKAIINRLARAIGHLESVKRMVEDGKDCSEVLIQLAAVKAALNNTGKELLKEHISHCMVEAVQEQDLEAVEELNKAIDKFMK